MWSKKRISVSYTPRKLKRPSACLKRRFSVVDKTSSNVKVVVRVRPPSERDFGSRQVVQVIDEKCLVFDPKESENEFYVGGHKQLNRDMLKKRHKNLEFQFDQVFDTSMDNQEVFERTTQDLIEPLLEGFNCSVFVYGATGAGKTYTMLGSKETPGIAYLTMVELYKKMEEIEADYKFDLKISYLEVYNETVKDLICPSGPLNIRDDGKDGIIIPGIKTHQIDSADELFRMLEYGNKNRTQHPTDANAESSRSHAVFQVHLCSTHKLTVETKVSKLTMIDLAGSERGVATGGKGIRFSEGSNINKSLLALGNCVDALAEGHKHIPYRNSKLTRILKDSLGGNSKTIMIVNVAPSSVAYEETFNTLSYATRAKKINNKARKNFLSVDMTSYQYKKIIEDLKQKITVLENENQSLRDCLPQTDVEKEELATKSIKDIERGREVLRCLYELEGKYRRELSTYQMKTKTVDWRIYQKQVKSERFQLFEYMLEDSKSRSRMDESMNKLKSQRKVYKEKVKGIQKLLKEKQTLREVALKDIEVRGLTKELQKDIEYYAGKMKEEIMAYQVQYYKDLLLKQQHEMTSSDKIIGLICKNMDYYYSVLNGSGRISKQMSEEYLGLVEQLAGVKSVSWEDESTDFTLLRKVMDLSLISADSSSESSSPFEQRINDCPEISQDLAPTLPMQYTSPPPLAASIPCTPVPKLCTFVQIPCTPVLNPCTIVQNPCTTVPNPCTIIQNPCTPVQSLCTPVRVPITGHINDRQIVDIPEEDELPLSPVPAANIDFNKTFTVTPPMQVDVDTVCSPRSSGPASTNSLPSLNVTFTADSVSPEIVQYVSEITVPATQKNTLHSNSPSKPRPKVHLPRTNTVMFKGVLSETRSSSSLLNLKTRCESAKLPTANKDKILVQSSTGLKIRPGASIKVHFNALSEKNKLQTASLKAPVSKTSLLGKTSKISPPLQSTAKRLQKENSTSVQVKCMVQKVTPQDSICKPKLIKPGMIPVKRTMDNNLQRVWVPSTKTMLPR